MTFPIHDLSVHPGTVSAAQLGAFTGATDVVNGTKGAVPQPVAGDEDKILVGGGTWETGGIPFAAIPLVGRTVSVVVGDVLKWMVPDDLDGRSLTGVSFGVDTAGDDDLSSYSVDKKKLSSGSTVSMLATDGIIDSTERHTSTGTAPVVVSNGEEVLAKGDLLLFKVVTQVATTAPKGLWVSLTFSGLGFGGAGGGGGGGGLLLQHIQVAGGGGSVSNATTTIQETGLFVAITPSKVTSIIKITITLGWCQAFWSSGAGTSIRYGRVYIYKDSTAPQTANSTANGTQLASGFFGYERDTSIIATRSAYAAITLVISEVPGDVVEHKYSVALGVHSGTQITTNVNLASSRARIIAEEIDA